MNSFKKAGVLILLGVKDCISGIATLKHFWSDEKHSKKERNTPKSKKKPDEHDGVFDVLMKCFVFGALFYSSIKFYEKMMLEYGLQYLESVVEFDYVAGIRFLYYILNCILFFSWILPLFIVSRLLNYAWYQEIADLTFESTKGKKNTSFGFSFSLADQFTSIFIQVFFLAQGYAIISMPIPFAVKQLLSVLHLSILYSLYAFEYKWVQEGLPLNKRLSYIEKRWPYFIGFGLPLAILTSCVSTYLESIIVFSTFFPMYVFSSTVVLDSKIEKYCKTMPIFKLSELTTEFIIKYVLPIFFSF
ncbi:etoposide-induced protein 2.4 homolog [Uloborus diversus]|uniref:etoposide-induced protein 2.4 homolog n=1 Tax=Uloborus diversus TaxID=327109 RepID=UPI002409F036|nr:etoposide-induced protein 2.4 homolog [Uloborus diversus]